MFVHSFDKYGILPLLCESKPQKNKKLNIFRKSEAKIASYQTWPFPIFFIQSL